jgi:hypothetical protein
MAAAESANHALLSAGNHGGGGHFAGSICNKANARQCGVNKDRKAHASLSSRVDAAHERLLPSKKSSISCKLWARTDIGQEEKGVHR